MQRIKFRASTAILKEKIRETSLEKLSVREKPESSSCEKTALLGGHPKATQGMRTDVYE